MRWLSDIIPLLILSSYPSFSQRNSAIILTPGYAVNPALVDYIEYGFNKGLCNKARLIVIKLNITS